VVCFGCLVEEERCQKNIKTLAFEARELWLIPAGLLGMGWIGQIQAGLGRVLMDPSKHNYIFQISARLSLGS